MKSKRFGLIRELKVNGAMMAVGKREKKAGQHNGIGTKLLKIAEKMISREGIEYSTVTSAVGVRDYYRKKHHYELDPCGLMWKRLEDNKDKDKLYTLETTEIENKYKYIFEDKTEGEDNRIITYFFTLFLDLAFFYVLFYIFSSSE